MNHARNNVRCIASIFLLVCMCSLAGCFGFGEEAPLVGRRGSGTIIFSHCKLRCCFCQDWEIADRHWGARACTSYAYRSLLDCSTRLAFGSDAPVEPFAPLLGVHAAVTRRRLDGSPGPDGWWARPAGADRGPAGGLKPEGGGFSDRRRGDRPCDR